MRRALLAVLTLAAFSGAARADVASRGTAAGVFLRLAPGARGSAMGESFAGAADDAYAAWYNPAGLASLEKVEAAGAHESRFEGMSYDAAILAIPMLSWRDSPLRANAYGVTALSVYSLAATDIQRRGLVETDAPSGTFGASDRAYALSYAFAAPGTRLSFGGSAKFVDSSIDASRASALTWDGGALWRGERSSAGAGVRGFGGSLRYASVADPLPTVYYLGLALRPREGWLLTSELDIPKQDASTLGFGFERRWVAMPGLTASARAGYRTGRADAGILAGASLGFGAAWRGLEADFSWSPGGAFGDLFKYSVLIRLGEGR